MRNHTIVICSSALMLHRKILLAACADIICMPAEEQFEAPPIEFKLYNHEIPTMACEPYMPEEPQPKYSNILNVIVRPNPFQHVQPRCNSPSC